MPDKIWHALLHHINRNNSQNCSVKSNKYLTLTSYNFGGVCHYQSSFLVFLFKKKNWELFRYGKLMPTYHPLWWPRTCSSPLRKNSPNVPSRFRKETKRGLWTIVHRTRIVKVLRLLMAKVHLYLSFTWSFEGGVMLLM